MGKKSLGQDYQLKEVLPVEIGEIINQYGEKYSPYRSGLVNHLPMAQLALYKMTGDINKLLRFSKSHVNKTRNDPVIEDYAKCSSTRECLGKRDMYESYLELLKEDMKDDNLEEYVSDILNKYPLGMSSGLFHTIIRIYYAIDGYKMDKELIDEVRRATSYYVTGYREADLFKRKIKASDIIKEMKKLVDNQTVQNLIHNESSTGKRIRRLYDDEEYMKLGFVLEGERDEKVIALLDMLLPLFINTGSIVVLHCITGLHALLALEEYYDDFSMALDILTTTIITHLLSIGDLDFQLKEIDSIEFSWDYILSLGSGSHNVHDIKLTYSAHQLSKIYPDKNLKRATLSRIDNI